MTGAHAHETGLASAEHQSSERHDDVLRFIRQKESAILHLLANRGDATIPAQVQRDMDYVDDLKAAAAFKPHSWFHSEYVEAAKAELERSLPGVNQRRRYELRMADYIQHKVLPIYGDAEPGLRDLPEKMRNCRESGLIGLTPQGDVKHRWPAKCNQSKLCAHEAREEAQRLSGRYLSPMVNYLNHDRRAKLQSWVISPKNVAPGELHDAKRAIIQTFAKLNRRKVARSIVGAVVVQEDPIGQDGNWNVHLNVLALVSGHFSWQQYRRAFLEELGHEHVSIEFTSEVGMMRKTKAKLARRSQRAGVHLVAVPTRTEILKHAFVECVKYTSKITGFDHDREMIPLQGKLGPNDSSERALTRLDKKEAPPMYAWPADMFFEWYRANRRFRRTRSYGKLFRVCDTCGFHGHTAADCPEIFMPDPDPEWIGRQTWDHVSGTYVLDIDLIPAHNSTFWADKLALLKADRSTGPPGPGREAG